MHTRTKQLLTVLAIVAVALTVTGCKKTAEKVAESIIEKSTNGQADVDVDNDQVTINTNGGSYQAGENISLPDGFPTDVYVVDGTIKSAITTKANEIYNVSIETTKSVSDVKSEYESKLQSEGWTITVNATYGGSASLAAEKANRQVSVIIGETDGKATVTLGTSVKEDTNTNTATNEE